MQTERERMDQGPLNVSEKLIEKERPDRSQKKDPRYLATPNKHCPQQDNMLERIPAEPDGSWIKSSVNSG